MPSSGPIFDAPTVAAIREETGLPLAKGKSICWLRRSLEDVAQEHYWLEFTGSGTEQYDADFSFDAVADPSVTPSRLRNRLVAIERSSKRVFSGTSRRPLVEKVVELLDRLGRDRQGRAMRYSGTETPGHGGSERSAVWLCLIRAIYANEAPPRGYRSNPAGRPWASRRLESTIQALVDFVQSPDPGRENADDAARAIHSWSIWSIQRVEGLLASTMARHEGKVALDVTLRALGTVYQGAFKRSLSLYRSSAGGAAPEPNAWDRFLQAVLRRILGPDELPSMSALQARWRHLTYGKR